MGLREIKKSDTRNFIMDTAMLLFTEKGYDQTSIDEVAAAARVSKGTLYNYFTDKKAVYVAYFHREIERYLESREASDKQAQSCREQLLETITVLEHVIARDQSLGRVYVLGRLNDMARREPAGSSGMGRWVHQIIAEGQKKGEIRDDISATVLVNSFQFAMMGYIMPGLDHHEYKTSGALEQVIDIFFHGVAAERGNYE